MFEVDVGESEGVSAVAVFHLVVADSIVEKCGIAFKVVVVAQCVGLVPAEGYIAVVVGHARQLVHFGEERGYHLGLEYCRFVVVGHLVELIFNGSPKLEGLPFIVGCGGYGELNRCILAGLQC